LADVYRIYKPFLFEFLSKVGEGGFISVDGFESALLKLVLEFLQFFASVGFRQTIPFEFFLLPGILIYRSEPGNPALSILVKKDISGC